MDNKIENVDRSNP